MRLMRASCSLHPAGHIGEWGRAGRVGASCRDMGSEAFGPHHDAAEGDVAIDKQHRIGWVVVPFGEAASAGRVEALDMSRSAEYVVPQCMAVEEDITLTIIISTTAVADELPDDGGDGDDPSDPSGPIDPNDPYDPSDPDSPNKPGKPSKPNDGITPPNTGDISQLGLWMMLAIASSSLMIALIVYLLKKKPLTEANTLEK